MFQFSMCIHPDKNCKLANSLTIRWDLLENLSVSCLLFRKIVCNATMCEIFLTILNSRRRLTCKTTALHRQFSSHKVVAESVNSSGKKVLPPIDGRNEVEPQQTPHTNQQALFILRYQRKFNTNLFQSATYLKKFSTTITRRFY